MDFGIWSHIFRHFWQKWSFSHMYEYGSHRIGAVHKTHYYFCRREICHDRSQSLFYFVPQEKRVTRRPPWTWKNVGESIFHPENMNIWPKTGQNRLLHMLRSSLAFSDFNYIHTYYWGQGSPFSPGHRSNSSQSSFGHLYVLLLVGWGFS